MALTFVVTSCNKEQGKPESIADKFIGKWTVGEEAQSSQYFNASFFNAPVFKVNDSTFGLIQSNRTRIPDWIYYPRDEIDYRTIHFKVNEGTREIFSKKPYCSGKYSLNMDTIQFIFETTTSTYYYVKQRLIRQ